MAEPPDISKASQTSASRNVETERDKERRRFAAGIARAELGRHYWSEASERALRVAMAKKPKPDKRR